MPNYVNGLMRLTGHATASAEERELIFEALSVEAIGGAADIADQRLAEVDGAPEPVDQVLSSFGGVGAVPLYDRETIKAGQGVDGPAIIREPTGTNVIESGWRAEMNAWGHLILTRTVAIEREAAVGTEVDPVMLEVFNNLFMSIAEQMGATLANTAYSVNIKERFDFSCALFDPEGGLVANAPHVPVHLGSMSESIRTIIRENPDMKPGDVFTLNDPYHGGTHLPDVTVITPVFDDGGNPLFYVASWPSRGHRWQDTGFCPA